MPYSSSAKHDINQPHFSHIYVEKDVADHPVSKDIINSFSESRIIPIHHYKDVFSRAGQEFSAQKESQKLILAAGRPPFLYRGADVCPSFGNPSFYYASSVMNCIYNCQYCYLQGMYPSANLVVFVDIEKIFLEVERTADKLSEENSSPPVPLYLCNSYDTDLLAIRRIIPLADRWLDFADTRQDVLIEMRTKSTSASLFSRRKPAENVIIAWTLSPDPVADTFEKGTPPLSARLKAAAKAVDNGWRVRLCIDPVLFVNNWEELYANLVEDISRELDTDRIESISFGVFRMGKQFLKRARKVNPASPILQYPYILEGGVYTYPFEIRHKILSFIKERLGRVFPQDKLFQTWK